MESIITWFLVTLGGAFVGSYLGGYLRKKGENLATHEDVDKLLAQVTAVTTATKEIEAKISSEVWGRQKRWELKREIILTTMQKLAAFNDALVLYYSTRNAQKVAREPDSDKWLARRSEALDRWSIAVTEIGQVCILLDIVCEQEAIGAVDNLVIHFRRIATRMFDGDLESFEESLAERQQELSAVRSAFRKELEIGQ